MMRNIINLLFIFAGVLQIKAQHSEDTIMKWKAKFAILTGIPKISPKGNWIAISKSSKPSADSTFVISTQDKNDTKYRILNSNLTFLNEEGVLGQIALKAEFLNLKTGKHDEYDHVVKGYVIEKYSRYALLKNDRHLVIYNLAGDQLLDIEGVDNVVTDSKDKLYFKKKNALGWAIIETSGDKERIIYSTVNQINKIELTQQAKQLIMIESAEVNDKVIVFDTKLPSKKLLELVIPKQAMVNFTELLDGEAYLISARVKYVEEKVPLVEVWYGNDPYVNEHYKKFVQKNYWVWHPKNGNLKKIQIPGSYEVNSLNNERYFLAYLPRKGHNYVTSEPELNGAQIYDVELNTLTNLGNFKTVRRTTKEWDKTLDYQIFCSPNGKRFLASNDGVKWNLYNANGQKALVIERKGLEQPTFSTKGDQIYFESSDDLWSYNIKKKMLIPLNIGKGKMIKIKNNVFKGDNYTTVSFLPTEKLLVEVYDKAQNLTSYKNFSNSKWQQIIAETKNRIANNLIHNPEMTSFFSLEENFNMPPALYVYNTGEKKRLLFDGDIKDDTVKKIKQKIYDYAASGKLLKGILFYPVNFEPQKIYPMVVRIYDMQRYLSNGYLSPNKVMPEGFQIRTLLERGYFVYLPDIAVDEKGPGLSALECVNSALDAVLENPSINPHKIGLSGQSFGGYETNFIATQSNRFAAYISGSGISDIIGNYYSYNFSFNKPNYFLYDSTIYRMHTPIAADIDRFLNNNPILHVEKVTAPMLLWAGKKDSNVPFDQSMQFYMGLRRYRKNVIALFYKNGGHSFPSGSSEEKDLSKKVLDWWDFFLQDIREISWINKQMNKDAY